MQSSSNPAETEYFFNNLRIWDGTSADYQFGHIYIADGCIAGIQTQPFEKGKDCEGLTLLPGLIDAHVHMVLNPKTLNPLDQITDGERLLPEMIERARCMVDAGITTARDLGGGCWHELQLRDMIRTDRLPGPRLICAGQPITSLRGHCHFWGGEAEDLDAVMAVIDRQVEKGVDLIKLMATGGNITQGSRPVDAQFTQSIVSAIARRASELGLHTAAHCHGTEGIAHAAAAGITTIEHCSWVGDQGWGLAFDPVVAQRIATNGIRVSPTINAGWARFKSNQQRVDLSRKNFAELNRLGVQLIASTDAGIPNVFHHHLPVALPIMQHFTGLTPVEILRSATSACAAAISLGDVTGCIAQGFSADLLFLEGDPLQDLHCLEELSGVMARGIMIRTP